MVLFPMKAERVEIRNQMTTHPIGADHHQRPDAVEGGGVDLALGGRGQGGLRRGFFFAKFEWPFWRPACTAEIAYRNPVPDLGKEGLPAWVNGTGTFQIPTEKLLDEGGIGAGEEGGFDGAIRHDRERYRWSSIF